MYQRLSSTIVFFVTLFGALTVVVLLARVGCAALFGVCTRARRDDDPSLVHPLTPPPPQKNSFIQWPWNLLWAETVSWEVLNFAVLAAVCWIWRPSPTSKFLAQARATPLCVVMDIDALARWMDSSQSPLFLSKALLPPHSPTTRGLHDTNQAKQLPTSEAAANGEEGIEFSISSQFSIADDEDLDDDDLDHHQLGGGTVAHLR